MSCTFITITFILYVYIFFKCPTQRQLLKTPRLLETLEQLIRLDLQTRILPSPANSMSIPMCSFLILHFFHILTHCCVRPKDVTVSSKENKILFNGKYDYSFDYIAAVLQSQSKWLTYLLNEALHIQNVQVQSGINPCLWMFG